MKTNKTIRIEEVADINFDYSYLEVFYLESSQPFLDIGITDKKELIFKFYPVPEEINLSVMNLEYILNTAKAFLPKALKDEEDFLTFNENTK